MKHTLTLLTALLLMPVAAHGHADLAADISDKTIANAIKNGTSEHYDSISGKPLGVPDYCISCTLVTMMLDGLAKKYTLKLRGRSDLRLGRRSDGQSH